MRDGKKLKIYFSDFFNVLPEKIDSYGAFNISLINDLPLFIDPFLLFNSEKSQYQILHESIVEYVRFLKSKSSLSLSPGALESWFYFPEVKQNWLGFSKMGNNGRGLRKEFAKSLKTNLVTVFKDFGEETETGSHLGKLTLVKDGVGKDSISDFTCNLIAGYLAEFTAKFAKDNIDPKLLALFPIKKFSFNYKTQTWISKEFMLPRFGKDFVLLSPVDLLTKDEAWINHQNFVEDFTRIVSSVSNGQLRNQIDVYFTTVLPVDARKDELEIAIEKVIAKFPSILDYYVAYRESQSAQAVDLSIEKIRQANKLFVEQLTIFINLLDSKTKFYGTKANSFDEGVARVSFLKDVIENQDGYKLFYINGKPVTRESDLQIMFKLTWFASDFSSDAEVNNGRGPADFIVSYGSKDKTVIEFKLASSSQLDKNMQKQAEIYSKAARATHAPLKVILYFTDAHLTKVKTILKKHGLIACKDIILIDARNNKVSASKA